MSHLLSLIKWSVLKIRYNPKGTLNQDSNIKWKCSFKHHQLKINCYTEFKALPSSLIYYMINIQDPTYFVFFFPIPLSFASPFSFELSCRFGLKKICHRDRYCYLTFTYVRTYVQDEYSFLLFLLPLLFKENENIKNFCR